MPRGMAIFFARKQRSRRLRKNGLLLILPQKRAGLQFLSHIFAGAGGPGAERMSPSFQRGRKRGGNRRCTTQAPTPPGALRGRRTEGMRRFFFALNRKSNKILHIFHFLLVHDIQIMYTYSMLRIIFRQKTNIMISGGRRGAPGKGDIRGREKGFQIQLRISDGGYRFCRWPGQHLGLPL